MEDNESLFQVLFTSVVAMLVVTSVQALLIEYAWSYSVAEIFSVPKIYYWQAFALKILFSNLIERITNDSDREMQGR